MTSRGEQQTEQDERPQQVPLLLDRERPRVLQGRRHREEIAVLVADSDGTPVRGVAQRRERVGAKLVELVSGRQHRGVGAHRRDDHEHGGEQPPAPPQPEGAEVDRASAVPFREEQGGDQEAGEDEERVDAQEPALHPRDMSVVQQHCDDGERAHPVERGLVGEEMGATLHSGANATRRTPLAGLRESSHVAESDHPVVIAGGGLVGLSTAMFLAQHGVPSLVIERLRGGSPVPRAAHFHLRTIELFRAAGIEQEVKARSAEEFLPEGAIISMDTLAGRKLADIIPGLNVGIDDALSPCRRLFITQRGLEPILRRRARAAGAEVIEGSEVVHVSQDPEGVDVEIADVDGGAHPAGSSPLPRGSGRCTQQGA